MAVRRMFSKGVICSDAFMRLPAAARTLYIVLNMHADDDGFVDNVQTIMRMTKATNCDLTRLIEAGLVIRFSNGVAVITHWRIHNLIRKDRYTPTQYPELLASLNRTNGVYSLAPIPAPQWRPTAAEGKVR